MTGAHAIVSGASIAGLSAALWLHRAGWDVTVLERAPQFRSGGQNVDVRGIARDVLDRAGLTERVRALNTTETATVIVGDRGPIGELPSDGPDGPTAEFEILRGDLAGAIREVLPPEVVLRFGESVTAVHDGGRRVTTTSGDELRGDLLVIAEGVRSTTRDLVFADDVVTHVPLGIDMVFGTIARTADDDDRWRWYITHGGRQVHLRPDPHGTTRALLSCTAEDELVGADRDRLLGALRRRFGDVGWAAPRILDAFADTDDLYVDRLEQIRMSRWSEDRVVCLGDAAWCVTPLGGGGSSLALTAGYVLAASVPPGGDDDAVRRGLADTERWLRPVVDEVQSVDPRVVRLAYPRSRAALAATRLAVRAVTRTPLSRLVAGAGEVVPTDRELPEFAARR